MQRQQRPIVRARAAPVQAQSGFSNASLTGTYGVSFVGADVASGSIQGVNDGIATVHFDGQGYLTSGNLTEYTSSGPCTFTLTGTYSVASSGAVSLTVNSGNPSSNCTVTGPSQYSGEVSQNGDTAVFAESDGTASGGGFLSGTAIKQQ